MTYLFRDEYEDDDWDTWLNEPSVPSKVMSREEAEMWAADDLDGMGPEIVYGTSEGEGPHGDGEWDTGLWFNAFAQWVKKYDPVMWNTCVNEILEKNND